jgi:hypothetical protein
MELGRVVTVNLRIAMLLGTPSLADCYKRQVRELRTSATIATLVGRPCYNHGWSFDLRLWMLLLTSVDAATGGAPNRRDRRWRCSKVDAATNSGGAARRMP